jgi:hypothetical protein
MVPTEEAKITFGMLYSADVPAAIASILLAILPPEKLWTNWAAFLPPSQRGGCATLSRLSSNMMDQPLIEDAGRYYGLMNKVLKRSVHIRSMRQSQESAGVGECPGLKMSGIDPLAGWLQRL